MKKNKELPDTGHFQIEVQNKALKSIVSLIEKKFSLNKVQIIFNDNFSNSPVREEFNTIIALERDGAYLGAIVSRDPNFKALNEVEQSHIKDIARMLIFHLETLDFFSKREIKYLSLSEENTQHKAELDLAYEDLNIAHQELNEAYNIGVLLNRNLEKMRLEFKSFLEQAPVAFAILRYRRLRIDVANSLVLKLWGKNKTVIGKTLSEALPELQGQPYLDILDDVYTKGVRYLGDEAPVSLTINGNTEMVYFNFIYEPLKNEKGKTNAIMIIATDVTETVRNRVGQK